MLRPCKETHVAYTYQIKNRSIGGVPTHGFIHSFSRSRFAISKSQYCLTGTPYPYRQQQLKIIARDLHGHDNKLPCGTLVVAVVDQEGANLKRVSFDETVICPSISG